MNENVLQRAEMPRYSLLYIWKELKPCHSSQYFTHLEVFQDCSNSPRQLGSPSPQAARQRNPRPEPLRQHESGGDSGNFYKKIRVGRADREVPLALKVRPLNRGHQHQRTVSS